MGELDRDDLQNLAKLKLNVGIAYAMYNSDIVEPMLAKCKDRLVQLHLTGDEPETLQVPGALELAHGLRLLEQRAPMKEINVLIALGCVIRGDTYHFEIVCDVSANSLQRVNEDTGIPVVNGVLTCENMAQAKERVEKGVEFAESAMLLGKLGKVHK